MSDHRSRPQQPISSQQLPEPAVDLDQALSRMTYEVVAGKFALTGFPEEPSPGDLEALAGGPGQLIREGGETTLLVPEGSLPGVLQAHPSASVESGLIWIRFRAPMSWEVVGFLARVTSALAAAGVPLGAVCGFSRDHLFIHERFLESTIAVLDEHFKRHPAD
jgi:hypothetical protein